MIGLALLVPFIGIVAAIAIPNLLTAMQRSRQKRTMADMRYVGTALEAYAADHQAYPQGDSLDAVRALLTPKYIKQVPTVDGWTHAYRYAPVTDGYRLVSAGADGVFDHPPAEYQKATTDSFNCDLVYANGEFVVYPTGDAGGGK